MSNRAVITLQLGHYANHVGAHFWNLQEGSFVYGGGGGGGDNSTPIEICHDVLFREGLSRQGHVTYTPRLVAVDLRGSLGLLPELGSLYDRPVVPKTESLLWDGQTQVQKEEPGHKNDFQKELDELEASGSVVADQDKDVCDVDADSDNGTPKKRYAKPDYDLDDQVNVWSDFLRTGYHPKTNVLLTEYQHNNKLQPFDVFGLGQEAWRGEGTGEEIEDRLRFFAEEADSLQGFHLLFDSYDAFGGLSSSLTDLLADEYGSKALAAFPVSPCHYEEYSAGANSSRFLNSVLGVRAQLAAASLVTPLSLDRDTFSLPGRHRVMSGVEYKPELKYHSSALLAVALDSMTMPWRRSSTNSHISEITSALGAGGRKVASASLAVPFPLGQGEFLIDRLNRSSDGAMPTTSLTPACHETQMGVRLQSVSVRGAGQLGQLGPKDFRSSRKYADHPYAQCEGVSDALERYFSSKMPQTVTAVSEAQGGFDVSRPFPRFFKFENGAERRGVQKDKMSALTCWQSSKGSADYVQSLHSRAAKISLGKMHRFTEAGLEQEDFDEALEDMASLKDCYSSTDAI